MRTFTIYFFTSLLILLSLNSSLTALAERPSSFGRNSEPEELNTLDLNFDQPIETLDTVDLESDSETSSQESQITPAGPSRADYNSSQMIRQEGMGYGSESENEEAPKLSEDEFEIVEKYNKAIQQKQFDKAKEIISELPTTQLTKEQRFQLKQIDTFKAIDADEAENIRQFGKDESLDPGIRRSVKRLQREAKYNILFEKSDLARDILIQSLYLDRKNFLSKQLLNRSLNLPLGSYRVENIEAKYWKESLIFLRGGYPIKAIEALELLANFDPENPSIFERMGSAYYMSGQIKEAIKSWKRAIYLDPDNSDLKEFIKNAEVEQKKQDAMVKEYFAAKKKAPSAIIEEGVEMQILRVVADSNTAYSYAQEVRQQMKNAKVTVEELDNGKWAVKIPRVKKEKK